eukprot:g7820.t1
MVANKVAPSPKNKVSEVSEPATPLGEKQEFGEEGDNEQEKTKCHPFNMIDPDHKWRLRWDALLMLFIVYNAIFVPMIVAFGDKYFHALEIIDHIADTAFILDLFVSFRTGFYVRDGADKVLVLDQTQVAIRYMRGWLLIDIAAIGIPYGLMDGVSSDDFVRYILSLTALLKLLRLARIGRLLSKLVKLSMEYQNVARISKLLVVFLYFAHFFGCIFYFIGKANNCAQVNLNEAARLNVTLAPDDDKLNCEWTSANNLADAPLETKYITSLYWAMMTATTVGYGDISITNNYEKVYATLIMILSNVMGAVIFGNVTTLIQNLNAAENRHSSRTEMIEELIETHKIEDDLAERMRATVEYQWDLTKCFDMDQVLEYMPKSLRVEVLMYVHKQLIMKVPFFQDCDDAFIKTVVYRLKSEIALEGDTLFEQGDAANEMYFLRRGVVAVVAPNSEEILVKLSDGSYFGEIGVLVEHGKRMFAIKALKKCEYYMLTKNDLDWVTNKFPEYREVLRLAALKRLEKSNAAIKNSHAIKVTHGRILIEVRNVTGAGAGVDKFCKVQVRNSEQRSAILGPNSPADNFDLNSIFNFHFEMKAPEKITDLDIKIKLMHNRSLLGEHCMGTGIVPLAGITRGEYSDRWLSIGKGPSGNDIKLYMRILVHEDGQKVDEKRERTGVLKTLATGRSSEFDDFDLPGDNGKKKNSLENAESKADGRSGTAISNVEDRLQQLESNIQNLTSVLASIADTVARIENNVSNDGGAN